MGEGKEGVGGRGSGRDGQGTPMSKDLKAQKLRQEEEKKGRSGTEASLGPAPEWGQGSPAQASLSAGSTLAADVACKGWAHNLWPLPVPFLQACFSLPSSVGSRAGFEKRQLDLRLHCPASQKRVEIKPRETQGREAPARKNTVSRGNRTCEDMGAELGPRSVLLCSPSPSHSGAEKPVLLPRPPLPPGMQDAKSTHTQG